MEVYYPATSSLFSLSPCKACSNGWTAEPDFTGVASNGSSYGWIYNGGQAASIELNFTGSAISFDLGYAPGVSADSWTTALSINGSEAGTGAGAKDLPMGQHAVKLDLQTNSTDQDAWIRFDGASVTLNSLVVAGTRNETIDDTAWREWRVILSPGWNMLEQNESNWINGMDAARSHADAYWNQSVSWTEQQGANTTILFSGSAFWTYGITGDNAGHYEVILDNVTMGVYNASSGPAAYQSLLYAASDLEDTNHTVTLVNMVAGRRLSFDRLDHVSGLRQVPAVVPSATPSPSASAALPTGKGLSTGAIAGLAVGGSVLVIALTLWALLAWTGCGVCLARRIGKTKNDAEPAAKPPPRASFWRWSSGTGFSAPARPLRPSHAPPTSSFGPFVRLQEQPPATFLPTLGTMTRQLTADTSPPDSPANQVNARDVSNNRAPSGNAIATSFLRLSRSGTRSDAPFNWSHPHKIVPMPSEQDDDELPSKKRKPTALFAAMSDSPSPLTSLHDSFVPKLSGSKFGKSQPNRSISIKTAFDDEAERPVTPGGILDGYMKTPSDVTFGRSSVNPLGGTPGGQLQAQQADRARGGIPDWDIEESKYPSMGERNPRRLLSRILRDGRPASGDSTQFQAL